MNGEATPLPPGPYRVECPAEQGGMFKVWGRQGKPPDFTDGWAIPLVAMGMQSPMEWLADHLNASADLAALLGRFVDFDGGAFYITANGIRQEMPPRARAAALALRAALDPSPPAEERKP